MDAAASADAVKPTANNGGLLSAVTKVFRLRKSGIVPDDGTRKIKLPEIIIDSAHKVCHSHSQPLLSDEKLRTRAAMELLLAKLFASISAIKAAYAQLQIAQSPYDPDCIQSADETVVSELKNLSELKHCYFKKELIDMIPSQDSHLSADRMREQQSLLKTYDIVVKKLQSQLQLKDSEILSFKEKLQDLDKDQRTLEKRLNLYSSSLSALDNLHLSALDPTHFIKVYNHTLKSIRSFVKLMTDEMKRANWDIDAAADSIEPNVTHKFLAFESYVCGKMFAGFQEPNFSGPIGSSSRRRRRHDYFVGFMDLKSRNPTDENPTSAFGEFCRLKYLSLVHPKMEASFFGDVTQRNVVSSGGFPATPFFEAFAEMARRVWLLHCLGLSFEPAASIFQVRRGCRFSEVYMEECCPEAEEAPGSISLVAFTVVPGFMVGKTVVQCKVYVSSAAVQL